MNVGRTKYVLQGLREDAKSVYIEGALVSVLEEALKAESRWASPTAIFVAANPAQDAVVLVVSLREAVIVLASDNQSSAMSVRATIKGAQVEDVTWDSSGNICLLYRLDVHGEQLALARLRPADRTCMEMSRIPIDASGKRFLSAKFKVARGEAGLSVLYLQARVNESPATMRSILDLRQYEVSSKRDSHAYSLPFALSACRHAVLEVDARGEQATVAIGVPDANGGDGEVAVIGLSAQGPTTLHLLADEGEGNSFGYALAFADRVDRRVLCIAAPYFMATGSVSVYDLGSFEPVWRKTVSSPSVPSGAPSDLSSQVLRYGARLVADSDLQVVLVSESIAIRGDGDMLPSHGNVALHLQDGEVLKRGAAER